MLIRSEFDIQFHLACETPMVAMLHLHPSLEGRLRSSDELMVEHVDVSSKREIIPESYLDSFGNRCSRFTAPEGALRLSGMNVVETDGEPEPDPVNARQYAVQELPQEVLQFLLPSRYCEVDRFTGIAMDLFGWCAQGWERAAAIRNWTHSKIAFDYQKARSTKTAMDVFTEREGVCRDFQHLAITLSRAMNIPARYVTGQMGDIRMPYSGPGDFSAWYQVFLDGRWWNMDARHNQPRWGRLLMATGRDATDVAITTSFGKMDLTHFYVESNEIDAEGNKVPLPSGSSNVTKVGDSGVVPAV